MNVKKALQDKNRLFHSKIKAEAPTQKKMAHMITAIIKKYEIERFVLAMYLLLLLQNIIEFSGGAFLVVKTGRAVHGVWFCSRVPTNFI